MQRPRHSTRTRACNDLDLLERIDNAVYHAQRLHSSIAGPLFSAD